MHGQLGVASVARGLTATFSEIRAADVLPFIAAQAGGMALAVYSDRLLRR